MADKPTLFTKEEIAQLYAPFALDEHELREGPANKPKTKISWFTYVRREAIIKRLDDLFVGEWSMGYLNPQEPISKIDGTYYCAMHITIRGMRREYDGIGEGGDGQTSLKGASTDAFKRTASMWGLGLYLQNAPHIWTDSYKDKDGKNPDWDMKNKVEAEALRRSNAWVASLTNGTPANVMNLRTGDAPSNDLIGKAAWWPVLQNDDEVTNLYNHEQHLINAIRKVAADDGIDMDTVEYSKIKKILIDRKALQTGELAG